ncbi:MAG: SWIM zinc finger family protein [Pseudomonadota bacterium]
MWGLCQGSGKDPYKAQIELAGPSFKCTCPSRKFPCKHGLGLYLLYARNAAAFSDNAAPSWVSDWLESREKRSELKAAKVAEAAQHPEDAAAKAQGQQKRQEKRQGNVEAGLAVLDIWLGDLAREGLAALRSRPAKDWEAMAARLVDTQASGLAGRIRRAGMLIYGSSVAGWELAVARELAQVALLSSAYRRLAALPPSLATDVKTAIGWVMNQDEVLAEPGVDDHWHVCGKLTQDDGRIARRTCYLFGQRSRRWALILQFSAGNQPLPPPLIPGTAYQGAIHFYPGAAPMRAVMGPGLQLLGAAPAVRLDRALPALLDDYARTLARNPFVEQFPMLLESVSSQVAAEPEAVFSLRDAQGALLPLDRAFRRGWQLHALSGGAPVTVFGLWNGDTFLPLSVTVEGRLHLLDLERAE